jgi:hypothetical protein
MKYVIWVFGAIFLIFGASCNVLNPTANQVTIEASNQYGNSCPVSVNLDGNNEALISNGTFYQFPLVGPGSHILNFVTFNPSPVCSPSSTGCIYTNDNSPNYSVTFNTTAGTIYVASVTQAASSNCAGLSVIGPN